MVARTDSGRLFQWDGPPAQNARSPDVALLRGSDVTIIESEIEIEFFFENRIESKLIFWLVFAIDFDSWLILAKTTHCSEFKE